MRIVLASGSPRRREILMDMGYLFAILSPSVDELDDLSAEFETPEAFVLENARLKGDAVAAHSPDVWSSQQILRYPLPVKCSTNLQIWMRPIR